MLVNHAEMVKVASQHYQLGRFDEAERLCRQILTEDATCADGWHLLGLLAQKAGYHETAAEYLQRASTLNPGRTDFLNTQGLVPKLQNQRVEEELLARAQTHFDAGRFHDAEVIYRGLVASHPGRVEGWLGLGRIARAAGQWSAARDSFERAVQLRPREASLLLELGHIHMALDEPARAVEYFRQAQQEQPHWIPALHALGHSLAACDRLEEAITQFRAALKNDPQRVEIHVELAVALGRLRRHDEQLASLEMALQLRPDAPQLWHEKAIARRRLGQLKQALADLDAALRLQPAGSSLFNERGIVLAMLGQLPEAQEALERAIRLRPEDPYPYLNLANLHRQLGHAAVAERALLDAIRLGPTDPDAHFQLGQLLREQGRLAEALVSHRHAARFGATRVEFHRALGDLLAVMGQPQQAQAAYRTALQFAPHNPETLNDLGNLVREQGQEEAALGYYQQAVAARPEFAPAHANLASLLAEQGDTAAALQHYDQALRFQPSPRLRLIRNLQLPILYESLDHLTEARQQLTANLDQLHAEGLRFDPTAETMPTLFYLAYQGLNDRPIHERMAAFANGPRRLIFSPKPPTRSGKIRIGFLSRYLKGHTIGQLNCGVIARLSREHFEVTAISVGLEEDEMARKIGQSADRHVRLPVQLSAALTAVAALELDVLYYTDIGMDLFTYTLAFSRLAPVQCVTWGHPVTTGLPTMDYFISSEALEIPEGDEHYTEKLVRLPRLAVYYPRPKLTPPLKGRSFFGLPEHAHLYACPQSLFKFHPEFDTLLAEILERDPDGALVLLEGRCRRWNELLQARFRRTLAGLEGRIHWMPRQKRDDFLHLTAAVDVLLDPIHFGGGNTSYEGLALGTPIVTLPSRLLRGRLTYAMYQQMGLADLVAADPADYVGLAVRLGTDPDYRREMQRRILEACPVLFEDASAIQHLEKFLLTAMKRV